jgi:hypothetical protein
VSEAWRGLDLGGGGLQAANIRLAQTLKRRSRAYALLAAFPLGLHRGYLDDPRGAWLYRIASALAVLGAFVDWRLAVGVAALIVAALGHDIFWIERRIVALNKAIRTKVYLSQAPGAPEGFKGRYTDESEPARGSRVPSFAAQEQLLRELAKRQRGGHPTTDRGER